MPSTTIYMFEVLNLFKLQHIYFKYSKPVKQMQSLYCCFSFFPFVQLSSMRFHLQPELNNVKQWSSVFRDAVTQTNTDDASLDMLHAHVHSQKRLKHTNCKKCSR